MTSCSRYKQGENWKTKASQSHEKKDKQMLISVVLIVAVFLVCNSFESVLFVLANQGYLPDLDIFWDYLRPTANFLMVLNSSVNSLIYGICNSTFRKKFAGMFLSRFKKKSEDQSGIALQSKMTTLSSTPSNSRKTSLVNVVISSTPSGHQETAF